MAKYICGGKKYQIAGPKEDTIGLCVQVANLPREIEVENHKLLLKTSFHVSLVCIGHIAERYKVLRPDFINEIVNDFCSFVQDKSIDFIRYRNEFRLAAQDEKRSVVVMCDVSNLDEFYELINKKYGPMVKAPPTHITLYTLQPDIGIFLTNADDVNNLTKVIIPPASLKIL